MARYKLSELPRRVHEDPRVELVAQIINEKVEPFFLYPGEATLDDLAEAIVQMVDVCVRDKGDR